SEPKPNREFKITPGKLLLILDLSILSEIFQPTFDSRHLHQLAVQKMLLFRQRSLEIGAFSYVVSCQDILDPV
ncbi:MAG: hypothetical protein P8Y96_08975, partial [Desulfuromonadales bacterium]